MRRKGILAATTAAVLFAATAVSGCGANRDIEGFYEGMRAIQLMYPSSSSGTNVLVSLEARIEGRTIVVIMNDCTFEARWERGADTFTNVDDFFCTVQVQGDPTDMFGSGTVTAAGDGMLGFAFDGMATDGTTGEAGTWSMTFSGTLVEE